MSAPRLQPQRKCFITAARTHHFCPLCPRVPLGTTCGCSPTPVTVSALNPQRVPGVPAQPARWVSPRGAQGCAPVPTMRRRVGPRCRQPWELSWARGSDAGRGSAAAVVAPGPWGMVLPTRHRAAQGGSWGGHPSCHLSRPGCPAHGHRAEQPRRRCPLSPVQAGWPSSPAPLPVWDGDTDGSPHCTPHRRVRHTAAPLRSGWHNHRLLSPTRSRASSYLFLHIVLRFLFSTLFVPFVSCLAELHVLGAAHRPAHWAVPAQPGPKCQPLKEMP